MKSGRSISELAAELERRAESKRDYVASTAFLSVMAEHTNLGSRILIRGLPVMENFRINHHALRQIGSRLNIPAKYVDRMRKDAPQLLSENINHWFRNEPERRMLRTDGNGLRAFLSDRYRVIDNEQIAESVFPILADIPDLVVQSCEVTDSKLYIKAVTPRVNGEVVGDTVQAGVIVSNSEIGLGSVSVRPMAFELSCLNGWITGKGLSKYHVGRANHGEDEVREVMSDEAMQADDKALMLKLRDVLKASIEQVQFNKTLDKMRAAKGIEIGDPNEAIQIIENRGWLNQDEGRSVLKHLIEGADLSALGLGRAITRASQDIESYDRATDLEELGGQVIELPRNAWQQVAQAA